MKKKIISFLNKIDFTTKEGQKNIIKVFDKYDEYAKKFDDAISKFDKAFSKIDTTKNVKPFDLVQQFSKDFDKAIKTILPQDFTTYDRSLPEDKPPKKDLEISEEITEEKQSIDKSKFTIWENKILTKLRQNKVDFNEKYFDFTLSDGMVNYTPDFILDRIKKDDKEIIIEAHENFSNEDALRYAFFLQQYAQGYYLILIVPDEQIDSWYNYLENQQSIPFNEIWSEDNLDECIEKIHELKSKAVLKIYQLPPSGKCPRCGIEANTQLEVAKIFGPRKNKKGKIIRQSLCKKCR